MEPFSTLIKRGGVGLAIREAEYFFILQGLEMGWTALPARGDDTQKEVGPKTKTLFVMKKHVEDVKQDASSVPLPVESIRSPLVL